MAENTGTIVVLEKTDKNLRCPWSLGGENTVDPKTGFCSTCERTFKIKIQEKDLETVK